MNVAARRAHAMLIWMMGAILASSALATEPDPHEIYFAATKDLRSGNLEAAGARARKLRDLITQHPEWDPGAVFARELLPPVEARLQRLSLTAEKLEKFTQRALRDETLPEIDATQDPARVYGDWARRTIDRLRAERDGLIATALPAAEDQALLVQTDGYARSEHLLETDILHRMTEAIDKEIKGIPEERGLQTMHDRLDQLKKGMIASVVERDRVGAEMEELRARTRAYHQAFVHLLLDGSSPIPTPEGGTPEDLSSIFSGQLDRELEGIRSGPPRSHGDFLDHRESLEQYRLYNRVLTDAGLIEDQTERINKLSERFESTPLAGREGSSTSISSRLYWSVIGFLVAATAGVGWRMVRRRRWAIGDEPPSSSRSSSPTGFTRDTDGKNAA